MELSWLAAKRVTARGRGIDLHANTILVPPPPPALPTDDHCLQHYHPRLHSLPACTFCTHPPQPHANTSE